MDILMRLIGMVVILLSVPLMAVCMFTDLLFIALPSITILLCRVQNCI
jgi:hypothetical protein